MRGFRIGRVLGFEIRIDFSWFILFALILWSFSAWCSRECTGLASPACT
jgi:hypothetical protein